jgi:probable addiction module antidote protein
MKKAVTTAWDAAKHLESVEDMAAYLEAAFEDGDPALIAAALGDVARAQGMTQVARDAGLGRESLYKALSSDGNPELATVLRVLRALGLRLRAVPAKA